MSEASIELWKGLAPYLTVSFGFLVMGLIRIFSGKRTVVIQHEFPEKLELVHKFRESLELRVEHEFDKDTCGMLMTHHFPEKLGLEHNGSENDNTLPIDVSFTNPLAMTQELTPEMKGQVEKVAERIVRMGWTAVEPAKKE